MAGSFLASKSPSLPFKHVSFPQGSNAAFLLSAAMARPSYLLVFRCVERTQMSILSLVSYSPPCNSRQQNVLVSNSRILSKDIQAGDSSWCSAKWLYKVVLAAHCSLNLPATPIWVSAFSASAAGAAGLCKTGSEAFAFMVPLCYSVSISPWLRHAPLVLATF